MVIAKNRGITLDPPGWELESQIHVVSTERLG